MKSIDAKILILQFHFTFLQLLKFSNDTQISTFVMISEEQHWKMTISLIDDDFTKLNTLPGVTMGYFGL
jgi:hypothetical protein